MREEIIIRSSDRESDQCDVRIALNLAQIVVCVERFASVQHCNDDHHHDDWWWPLRMQRNRQYAMIVIFCVVSRINLRSHVASRLCRQIRASKCEKVNDEETFILHAICVFSIKRPCKKSIENETSNEWMKKIRIERLVYLDNCCRIDAPSPMSMCHCWLSSI